MNVLGVMLLVYLIGVLVAFIIVCQDYIDTDYDVTIGHIRKLPAFYLFSWVIVLLYCIAIVDDLIRKLDDIVIFKGKRK